MESDVRNTGIISVSARIIDILELDHNDSGPAKATDPTSKEYKSFAFPSSFVNSDSLKPYKRICLETHLICYFKSSN